MLCKQREKINQSINKIEAVLCLCREKINQSIELKQCVAFSKIKSINQRVEAELCIQSEKINQSTELKQCFAHQEIKSINQQNFSSALPSDSKPMIQSSQLQVVNTKAEVSLILTDFTISLYTIVLGIQSFLLLLFKLLCFLFYLMTSLRQDRIPRNRLRSKRKDFETKKDTKTQKYIEIVR